MEYLGIAFTLFMALMMILISAEGFTNAVEWLGVALRLSRGAVGSLLAAVGTALPETMIPIVAIFLYGGATGAEVGLGAILGAPFMLSTIAIFLVGAIAILLRRDWDARLYVEPAVFQRDMTVFLSVFSLALLPLAGEWFGLSIPGMTGWVSHYPELWSNRWPVSWLGLSGEKVLAILLIGCYISYAMVTLRKGEGGAIQPEKALYFAPGASVPPVGLIAIQMVGSLAVMAWGAHQFVGGVETLASYFGWPPLMVSFILAPIATELPEKFNSLLWVSRGEDTLAIGNITGAMVFQSSCIPALALWAGVWDLTPMARVGAFLTLASAATVLAVFLFRRRVLRASFLLLGGCYYALFTWWLVYMSN